MTFNLLGQNLAPAEQEAAVRAYHCTSLSSRLLSLKAEGYLTVWSFIFTVIAGIYTLVCFFWYARRETVSLAIGSKGGSNTPIAISGISGFGLYNTAALRALSAEPAPDAEAMIKELGAMISDIQTLGELGVRKWQMLSGVPVASALPQPVAGA